MNILLVFLEKDDSIKGQKRMTISKRNIKFESAKFTVEEWSLNGIVLHREVFPAWIEYKENGEIHNFAYCNRGKNITDQIKEYLEENEIDNPLDISPEHQIILKMKFW